MIYIVLYLVAILFANLDIVWTQQLFGYTDDVRLIITTVNAFLFIGFDLTARDGLHDAWHNKRLVPKMTILIASGSFLSWLLNRDAGRIAVASFVAFALSGIADALVYHLLLKRGKDRLARMNGSNLASAAVDSLLFPTLAFSGLNWSITAGQFIAKVGGGALWARIITSGKTDD